VGPPLRLMVWPVNTFVVDVPAALVLVTDGASARAVAELAHDVPAHSCAQLGMRGVQANDDAPMPPVRHPRRRAGGPGEVARSSRASGRRRGSSTVRSSADLATGPTERGGT
jgi:hypothetical protein